MAAQIRFDLRQNDIKKNHQLPKHIFSVELFATGLAVVEKNA